jgi:hypothetical protein
MNKIKLKVMFMVAAALLTGVVVQAESDKPVQSAKIKPKEVTESQPVPQNISQTPALTGSKQGYHLVTDVLDSFAGKSESDNYKIPVNSGGQHSIIGTSASTTFGIEAGFVLASKIKRGDVNANGTVDLGDAIYILNYLFKGGTDPCPMEAGDVNCTGQVDLGDAIFLLNYLFKGGPGPTC